MTSAISDLFKKQADAVYEEQFESRDDLVSILKNSGLSAGSYYDILPDLLVFACWKGTAKELMAALPLWGALDLDSTMDVLARLGFDTELRSARKTRSLSAPALHILHGEAAEVLRPGDPLPRKGKLLIVYKQLEPVEPPPQTTWLSWTISTLSSRLFAAFAASFFANVVGLALPFFTRYVYDRAIPTNSMTALAYLSTGVLIAVLFGLFFRILRSRLLTYAGGRLAYLSGVESLKKILALPLTVLIKSSTDAHILRLRDLERVREFVSGSFAATIMDAPFILLYLGAIAYLGGVLVIVPVCALILYALVIPLMSIMEGRAMRRASKLNAERSALQQDTVDKLKDLIGVGLENRWIENYSRIMVRSAAANRRFALVSAGLRIISRTASSATALATLVAGMWLVMNGSITPGGLIASMMLIWRITAPAQAFGPTFSRFIQLRHSARQVDRLMELPGENLEASLVSPLQDLSPTIAVNRVVFRHSSDREPALAGVSFQIEEGEIIGITGPNGAGKTTLLQVMAGLIHPQGGTVFIGGRDIRHFRPEDLRSWLGFMFQHDRPFRGTLRSNLLMAKPDATEEDLLQALEDAGAGGLVDRLEYGLDSFMYKKRGLVVRHDMQQAICIARALLKNPRILVFDEPIFHTPEQRDTFLRIIEKSRGNRTILIASHDRQLLAKCDKVLLLDQGVPISFGPVAQNNGARVVTTNTISMES